MQYSSQRNPNFCFNLSSCLSFWSRAGAVPGGGVAAGHLFTRLPRGQHWRTARYKRPFFVVPQSEKLGSRNIVVTQ